MNVHDRLDMFNHEARKVRSLYLLQEIYICNIIDLKFLEEKNDMAEILYVTMFLEQVGSLIKLHIELNKISMENCVSVYFISKVLKPCV